MNSMPPKWKMVHVQENDKTTEIRDAFDILRYKVVLKTEVKPIGDELFTSYVIQVFNCFYEEDPVEIDRKPGEGELPITDLCLADKIYHNYIQVYTSLLKAETRDYQDIDIYALKVGYKRTCPKCCATCRWSKLKGGHFPHPHVRLECFNPKNCTEYDFDAARRMSPPTPMPGGHHQIGKPHAPFFKHDRGHKHLLMHPDVDWLGVCDNYEEKEQPK